MRRWKKVALALLCLLVLSQAPLAYRRYRLGSLRAAIDRLNASRAAAVPADDPYADYAGVFHVHSALGGHSRGTFDEIVEAARANGLAFVVMTEHPSRHVDTSEATLRGLRDGVLFVNGSELAAASGERAFALPGLPSTDAPDAQALVNQIRSQGRLPVLAYPEEIRDWGLTGYDAIEVYNLFTDAKDASYALLFFDGLWSYGRHAELLFTNFYDRPQANLQRWDALTAGGRRLSAVAGNDAHSNVGLDFGDRTGKSLFAVKLDPYERSFRVVRNHVLLERGQALDASTLLEALRRGRSYIAFDLFGDSTGFRFSAEGSGLRATMGDEVALPHGAELRLRVAAPAAVSVLLYKDGSVVRRAEGSSVHEFGVSERGVYRVEVYAEALRDHLGERPWIISNPIYVR